jgi:hypothetical protein
MLLSLPLPLTLCLGSLRFLNFKNYTMKSLSERYVLFFAIGSRETT